MRIQITPTETRLIRAIDDAAIKIASPPKGKDEQTLRTEVDVSDGRGAAAMLRGMGAKKRKKEAKHAQ